MASEGLKTPTASVFNKTQLFRATPPIIPGVKMEHILDTPEPVTLLPGLRFNIVLGLYFNKPMSDQVCIVCLCRSFLWFLTSLLMQFFLQHDQSVLLLTGFGCCSFEVHTAQYAGYRAALFQSSA